MVRFKKDSVEPFNIWKNNKDQNLKLNKVALRQVVTKMLFPIYIHLKETGMGVQLELWSLSV